MSLTLLLMSATQHRGIQVQTQGRHRHRHRHRLTYRLRQVQTQARKGTDLHTDTGRSRRRHAKTHTFQALAGTDSRQVQTHNGTDNHQHPPGAFGVMPKLRWMLANMARATPAGSTTPMDPRGAVAAARSRAGWHRSGNQSTPPVRNYIRVGSLL